ncbi:Bacterial regulatory protein, luxR family [Enhygromyxa salina]|uniref:Bacterial regulatory protein, luxR family n=1 Tax=Enhygromyxa salina TaxID=215803 RepID=A0A2S9YGQ7_9BACT|nr:Bacterial regulatory protein, luxR family [Enhygromyxa salina]
MTGAYSFTAREQEVLHYVLFGHTPAAIAWRLEIRETTVHKHIHRIFAKTNTDTRKRLLDLALRLTANDAWVSAPRRAMAS